MLVMVNDGSLSYARLEELATHALHCIDDIYGELSEFLEEYDLELSEEEMEYFGLGGFDNED